MSNLLVFFAIPLATIILSAILETFIHNPIKVAGIFFSIFIVVAFALGGTAEYIVAAIIYTIISFVTALIVHRYCSNIVETTNTLIEPITTTATIETESNSRCYGTRKSFILEN